jgi:hypothetical protein
MSYTYSVHPKHKQLNSQTHSLQNTELDAPVRSMYNSLVDLSPHRQEIAKGLLALEAAIERLVDALSHGSFAAQVENATTERSAIRRVCDAYSTIDYGMEDDVNESLVCLGVIGVNTDTIKRAEAVNAAKTRFKDACTPLQGIRVRIPVKGQSSPTKAVPAIRVVLRNVQRSDLNLLAAYRKIPILAAPPVIVTYSRAHTRAVYRHTVDEIAEKLSNINSAAAIADRERLTALAPSVTHLALVKNRYQNVRANVRYSRLDTRGRGRIQISAELPLIYATGRRTEPPKVYFPDDVPVIARPKRRPPPSKLQAEPFLRSLPVYRYIQ